MGGSSFSSPPLTGGVGEGERRNMPEKSFSNLKLKIADIIMEMVSDGSGAGFAVDESHQPFVVSDGKPEMALKIHYGNIPKYEVSEEDKVFESGGVWSLYRRDGKHIMPLQSPALGENPYKLAILDSQFKSGDVYIRAEYSPQKPVYPLEYPLDEVLMVNLLSQGRGMEIHACGIIDPEGKGIVFSGTSGAGKSTLANLWKTKKDITILSDDRLIIRKREGQFYVYGTPWHGDAGVCSSENAPLEKIFFLEQAPENYIRKITKVDCVSRLLVRCFPTFYNSEGMEYTLNLCVEMSQEVPSYELGFVPNESVLDLVRKR